MNVSSWLKESPIDHLDSELIVAFVLGKDRTFVHAHPEYVFTEAELAKIQDFTTRRGAGEPLAYIFGTKEFYGHNFRVTRDTLIPRPETETIIDFANSATFLRSDDAPVVIASVPNINFSATRPPIARAKISFSS